MSRLADMAQRLAEERMERDRRIAVSAGCPTLLTLDAYMPQAIKDALVAMMHSERGAR